MVTEISSKPDLLFAEAPASWNTKYVTPSGFVCQLTIRADNGRDLLDRANAALSYLLEHGFTPDSYHSKSNGNSESKMCPIHKVEMRKFEKEGRSWLSHKLEEGGWCKGKPQKEGRSHE